MTEKEWTDFLKKYLQENHYIIKSRNEDCGVIKLSKKNYLLFTTDSLVEGIHFDFKYTSFSDLGTKLAVANLSDIAAMGGDPKWGLLTLGSPTPIEISWGKSFIKSLTSTLKKFNTYLIGGDTVKSPVFFVNLCLIGITNNPILRKGANPEDLIFVSKPLGGSAAFLKMIKTKSLKEIPKNLKDAHLKPKPEIFLGKKLSRFKLATSMIDISDGLLLDLWRICEENEVGAEIYEEKIPIEKFATLEDALTGGEDYALLFTVKKENIEKLKKLSLTLNRKVFFIGKIIKEKKLYLIKNKIKTEIKPEGFNHFVN